MFETFSVPAMCLCASAQLAICATGRQTGVSVCFGVDCVEIVPYYVECHQFPNSYQEGYPVSHGIRVIDFGGDSMTSYMKKILTERGFTFITTAEPDLVNDMKETLCYVDLDFDSEMVRSRFAFLSLSRNSVLNRHHQLRNHTSYLMAKL